METNKVTSDWFILELFTGQFQLEIAIGRIGDEYLIYYMINLFKKTWSSLWRPIIG